MQALVEIAEIQHWNHNPLLDAKSLGKGSMTFRGAGKDTLYGGAAGCFGADLREPPFFKNTRGRSSFRERKKLILGVAILRQDHQFLDILPIEKWDLCPLTMNLSGLVPCWPMKYGGRDVTWLPRLGHAGHRILPCLLVYTWNPEPCSEVIISVLVDSSSWAHPSSPPSPDTSHLHEISGWFLSPAVLINLRWGPRHYQVDKPCPLSLSKFLTQRICIIKCAVSDGHEFE